MTRISTDYSTKQISKPLIEDIERALQGVDGYGSIEIYIQDSVVTQITVRSIKKTVRRGTLASNGGQGAKVV